MSKKLECIKNLKQKIGEMQRQLNKIEGRSTPNHNCQLQQQGQKRWFNKTTTLADFNSTPVEPAMTKSPSWRNPTFWGSNPIFGKQNVSFGTPKNMKSRSPRYVKRDVSPQISQLRVKTDQNYYSHAQQNQRYQKQKMRRQKQILNKNKYTFNCTSKQTPRFEKIKTYVQIPTDPILNPQKMQEKGKKIIKKPSLSPLTNLVENPKSNPFIYFYRDKVLAMSPKHHNRKNVSPNLKQLLSSSIQEKHLSPKRKSCKKHFAKYFKQTYQSKWS